MPDDPCEKLLQDGLYSQFRMTNTGSFNQDFRTYLLSEQFKLDLKNGKWGGSITVPIEDVPVSLGANASNDETNEFRSKVLQASSFSVSSSYYQNIVSSIPNVDLARVYVECVNGRQFGFRVTTTSGEDWASFVIRYDPEVSTDPMPKVVTFDVRNGGNIRSALVVGQTILNANTVQSDRDPKKDLVLFLETDRGIATYKIPADAQSESSKDMPVGTIIQSYLTVEQFYQASKSNENSPGNIWTSAKSRWSPADGRAVPGSLYQRIASVDRVPDLRGMFLRGLNVMEAVPQVPLNESQSDPDSRVVGGYQTDQFKDHAHNFRLPGSPDTGSSVAPGNAGLATEPTTGATGGSGTETRPKNIAVYYYIRIN